LDPRDSLVADVVGRLGVLLLEAYEEKDLKALEALHRIACEACTHLDMARLQMTEKALGVSSRVTVWPVNLSTGVNRAKKMAKWLEEELRLGEKVFGSTSESDSPTSASTLAARAYPKLEEERQRSSWDNLSDQAQAQYKKLADERGISVSDLREREMARKRKAAYGAMAEGDCRAHSDTRWRLAAQILPPLSEEKPVLVEWAEAMILFFECENGGCLVIEKEPDEDKPDECFKTSRSLQRFLLSAKKNARVRDLESIESRMRSDLKRGFKRELERYITR
jgi:hypothetical protein